MNRGFATTSVQSKKQKEEAAALAEQQAAEAAEKAQAADEASKAVQAPVNGVDDAEVSKAVGVAGVEDWEREDVADEGILQGLVDRLQEKGDKEVARIVKVSYDQPNCAYLG